MVDFSEMLASSTLTRKVVPGQVAVEMRALMDTIPLSLGT